MCHWKFKSLLVDILFHEKVNHPVQAAPFENESYALACNQKFVLSTSLSHAHKHTHTHTHTCIHWMSCQTRLMLTTYWPVSAWPRTISFSWAVHILATGTQTLALQGRGFLSHGWTLAGHCQNTWQPQQHYGTNSKCFSWTYEASRYQYQLNPVYQYYASWHVKMH